QNVLPPTNGCARPSQGALTRGKADVANDTRSAEPERLRAPERGLRHLLPVPSQWRAGTLPFSLTLSPHVTGIRQIFAHPSAVPVWSTLWLVLQSAAGVRKKDVPRHRPTGPHKPHGATVRSRFPRAPCPPTYG